MKTLALFFALAVSVACYSQAIVKLPELQEMMNEGQKVKVVNFWATWCAPCIKEMPFLERLNRDNQNVKVLLVSLDFDLDHDQSKITSFVMRKKLNSEVVILDEPDPNAWIPKIDKNWSGALPATLIMNPSTGKRKLIQGELKNDDLEKSIAEVSK
ncbi:MAG: TlpA family protein disulfide reductase [Bacteroidetes bacterium]|nr:TlpA family protein disulfide reductase [Bacteroidota bacterium]MBI3483221.1 TlpA family protein disulfide reductase [Bacteroidota bacterium]